MMHQKRILLFTLLISIPFKITLIIEETIHYFKRLVLKYLLIT